MSNPLKSLLGQTAIYGLPTIVGRLLNYLLVPLYTYIFGSNADAYGAVSELYAWVAFLMILLTFGMETTFFRFFNEKENKDQVLRNSFLTVIGINLLFLLILISLNQTIAYAMLFGDHQEYIILMGLIVFMDAVTAVPMAKLRAELKAKKFALIHFSAIAVNIGLNLILLLLFYDKSNPSSGVVIILIANLLSSFVKVIGTYKEFLKIELKYDREMGKEMLKYAFPLVIAGFAGIINETLDRALLKHVLHNRSGLTVKAAQAELGIYSACYKLAMLATIFLQAFRYAAEPFFFSLNKDKDRNKTYVKIMNYFIAAVCVIFLGVSLNIDIFKHFIQNEVYWEGLGVVPILLIAGVFLGIYFNQSIWYKLSGQTKFGAYIAIGGASLTILINLIFIPIYGYWASAWATLIVYAGQMIASYLLGQKHYPINYNLRKFGLYFGTAVIFFLITFWIDMDPGELTFRKFLFHNFLILAYVGLAWFIEKPQKIRTNVN
ncbi:MAG: polysaccharide biosynthesis protein [Fluviicola sp. XM-24bin1]|mgnify:CR=1 FL=1|nr:MAG: polysaccharide biosynthesis protein [Fluviicola sp. XM-24bin1]